MLGPEDGRKQKGWRKAWRSGGLDTPPGRFDETDKAFGIWEGPVYAFLLYWIDNEIHHRGQGYVYLRALGIEPPPFYERT